MAKIPYRSVTFEFRNFKTWGEVIWGQFQGQDNPMGPTFSLLIIFPLKVILKGKILDIFQRYDAVALSLYKVEKKSWIEKFSRAATVASYQ